MKVDNLEHVSLMGRFADAGLELKILEEPIVSGRGNDLVFQMDIAREVQGNMRKEWFRIYLGKNTDLKVIDTDKIRNQLVLHVKEPKRRFTNSVSKRNYTTRKDVTVAEVEKLNNCKVIGQNRWSYLIERWTPSRARKYLLGVDERELFMCEIPRGNSVEEAHRNLKAPELTMSGGRKYRAIRQGEWFFIDPSEAEITLIKKEIENKTSEIRKKFPVMNVIPSGRRIAGTPHIADEIILIPTWSRGNVTTSIRNVQARLCLTFVRGSVKHPRHSVVKFKGWKKVIRNTELNSPTGQLWID